jgi:DNA polymerase V
VSECAGSESFALRVIGDSMAPEFLDGAIIIIEPEGVAGDGSYVLAFLAEEWTFRQLVRQGDAWALRPLNPAWPVEPVADLSVVRGVIVQQATPGRRRASRSYLPSARKDNACPTTSTK